jgi:hypothetical protein
MHSHDWRQTVLTERAGALARRATRARPLHIHFMGGAAMTKKRQSLTELIEEAVEKGARTVEEIHKSIADLPLKLMEESEFLRKPAREVRRLQDRTIGAIYDVIRDANRRIAKLASDLPDRQRRGTARRATGGGVGGMAPLCPLG